MNEFNESTMTRTEEKALNALLREACGRSTPPDLTDEILARLADRTRGSRETEVFDAASSPSAAAQPRKAASSAIAWTVAVVATLAASLLVAVSFWTSPDPAGRPESVASNSDVGDRDPLSPDDQLASDSPAGPSAEKIAESSATPPPGVPLVAESSDSVPQAASEPIEFKGPETVGESEPVELVSRQVTADLQAYWNGVGIAPIGEAPADEVAQRLSMAIGLELPANAIKDPESIQQQLLREGAAEAVATRWLQLVTDGGLSRMDGNSRSGLVAEVAESFRSRRSLDSLIVGWLSGEQANGPAFLNAMSQRDSHHGARKLASLTMNVDLRCVRCHDAQIESSGEQADYWSFVALLGGRSKKDNPLFYTAVDGREQLAQPGINTRWLAADSSIATIQQWSSSLDGSPQLARGVVNSLWTLVHGQSLTSRAVDAVTAPHHDALSELQRRLTDDLVQSQFDSGRTLALIIASPATRQRVPDALLPQNALVASQEQIDVAMDSVNAFAARLPGQQNLGRKQRIRIAMQRMGGGFDSVGSPVLAQPNAPLNPKEERRSPAAKLRVEADVDFPDRADGLPVQWLSSIEDRQNQVDHLAYLSGLTNVPEGLRPAISAMQKEADWNLALHRVWWLLRP